MVIDLLSLLLSFVLAYFYKFKNFNLFYSSSWMILLSMAVLLGAVITLFINPYSGILRRRYYEELLNCGLLAIYNFLLITLLLFISKSSADFSREVLLVAYALYFAVSFLLKYIWKKLLISGRMSAVINKPISLLIVVDNPSAREVLYNARSSDFTLYDVQGLAVPDMATAPTEIDGVPVVSSANDFADYVVDHNIEEVLISIDPTSIEKATYEKLRSNGIAIHLNVEPITGIQTEAQFTSRIGIYKTVTLSDFNFTSSQLVYLVLKRILDIISGLLGCVVLIPVIIAVKIVNLACGDHAPIFYTQTRIGLNGQPFKMLKLRTMVPDADKRLQEMLKEEKWRLEWEKNQKFENDPRITKAGNILRKTSLDEIPQLINVLKGQMSLIGPRPLVEGELEQHGGLKLYNKVKPGITGWWGCNGRSNLNYRERLELEYYYVQNCSLYLDIVCIIRTVLVVLKRDGAK
jgi:undecaprenyl-phosphate galactose phosphotransferase